MEQGQLDQNYYRGGPVLEEAQSIDNSAPPGNTSSLISKLSETGTAIDVAVALEEIAEETFFLQALCLTAVVRVAKAAEQTTLSSVAASAGYDRVL